MRIYTFDVGAGSAHTLLPGSDMGVMEGRVEEKGGAQLNIQR